jgi:hypothetical protein
MISEYRKKQIDDLKRCDDVHIKTPFGHFVKKEEFVKTPFGVVKLKELKRVLK